MFTSTFLRDVAVIKVFVLGEGRRTEIGLHYQKKKQKPVGVNLIALLAHTE